MLWLAESAVGMPTNTAGGSNTFQELMALASAFATSQSAALGAATIASDDDVRDGAGTCAPLGPSASLTLAQVANELKRRDGRLPRQRVRRGKGVLRQLLGFARAPEPPPFGAGAAGRRAAAARREIRVTVRCDAGHPQLPSTALLAIMPVRRRRDESQPRRRRRKRFAVRLRLARADAQTSALLSEPLSALLPRDETEAERATPSIPSSEGAAPLRVRVRLATHGEADARDETDRVAVATVPTTPAPVPAREQQRRADVGRQQRAQQQREPAGARQPGRERRRERGGGRRRGDEFDDDDDDEYVDDDDDDDDSISDSISGSERSASEDEEASERVEKLARGDRIMFRWDPPIGWLGATIKRQAKKAETPRDASSVSRCWLIENDDDGESMVVELRKEEYGAGLKWCAERLWRKAERKRRLRRRGGSRPAPPSRSSPRRASGASAAFTSSARKSVKRRSVELDRSDSESSDDEIVRPGRNRRRSSCVASDDDEAAARRTTTAATSSRLGVTGGATKGDRIAFVFREGLKYGLCLGPAPKPRDRKRGLFKVRWEEDGDTGTLVMLTEERQRCDVTIRELEGGQWVRLTRADPRADEAAPPPPRAASPAASESGASPAAEGAESRPAERRPSRRRRSRPRRAGARPDRRPSENPPPQPPARRAPDGDRRVLTSARAAPPSPVSRELLGLASECNAGTCPPVATAAARRC